MLRRLRKLEAKGQLLRLGRTPAGQTAWGNTDLTNETGTGCYSSSRTNLHTLEHDLLLNEVRFLLEEVVGVREWLDVRHMQANACGDPFTKDFNSFCVGKDAHGDAVIPDSLFRHTKEGKQFGFTLELELSLKKNSRYDRLLERYGQLRSVETVLFIVRNSLIKNAIMRGARRTYGEASKRYAIGLIDDLFTHREHTPISLLDGKLHPLKAFFDCNSPCLGSVQAPVLELDNQTTPAIPT